MKNKKNNKEWIEMCKYWALRLELMTVCVLLQVFTMPTQVFAGADPDASWNTVMEFFLKWIPRIGGVILFLGGIELAIAIKNEDAATKTNATRLMVSGAMLIGIPVTLRSLLVA